MQAKQYALFDDMTSAISAKKRLTEYINTHRHIVYTSQDGIVSDTLNTSEAIEAVEIAVEELDAAHQAMRETCIKTLKEIRSYIAFGCIRDAQIMINNLLIEMKG